MRLRTDDLKGEQGDLKGKLEHGNISKPIKVPEMAIIVYFNAPID